MARFRTQQRSYKVGESVHFEVKVTDAKTGQPVDPAAVTMTTVRSPRGEVVLENRAFLRREQGDYTYRLNTGTLVAEVYDVAVTISGVEGVAIETDQFVLEAV